MTTDASMVAGSLETVACLTAYALLGHLGDLTCEKGYGWNCN